MLVALRTQFPEHDFRLGKKVQSEVEGCEAFFEQPAECLLPGDRGHADTRKVIVWAYAWLEKNG
jgi:hypothetical protein